VPNTTPENRSKNRRVVFFIKSASIPKPVPGKDGAPAAGAAPGLAPPAKEPVWPPPSPAEPVPVPGPVGATVPPEAAVPTGGR
jgi:hypothetical protein